jgi:hypothetical protein
MSALGLEMVVSQNYKVIVWERHAYLTNVVNKRPMVRVSASVILAFCFATPLVWLFSNLLFYGLRSFSLKKSDLYLCTNSTGHFNSTPAVGPGS